MTYRDGLSIPDSDITKVVREKAFETVQYNINRIAVGLKEDSMMSSKTHNIY